MKNLIKKINDRTACIGVIGLGHVGLLLSMIFSKHFNTIDYDVYDKYITNLKPGKSHIFDFTNAILQKYVNNLFTSTNELEQLKICDNYFFKSDISKIRSSF